MLYVAAHDGLIQLHYPTQVSRNSPGKPKQPPPAPLPAPYFVQMGDGSLREFARLQLNFYGIKQACNTMEIRVFRGSNQKDTFCHLENHTELKL